jgi:hypothetical protein
MDPQVIAAGGTSGVAHTPTPCEERTPGPGVKGRGACACARAVCVCVVRSRSTSAAVKETADRGGSCCSRAVATVHARQRQMMSLLLPARASLALHCIALLGWLAADHRMWSDGVGETNPTR